jgi:two-component system, response regulator PdtaR
MGHPANQQTILVVEDDAIIRMSSVVTLEDAGFRVFEAKNSADALDMMAQHGDIEILLTDVRMPGEMDGLALVTRTQKDYPAIRAIVISGNATAEQACDAGASGFVAKPYLPHTMVRAIHDTFLRYQT